LTHPQLSLPLGWRDGGRFRDFHAGQGNRDCVEQLRACLAAGDQAILLVGPSGSGKTHLLLAALAECPIGGGRYLSLDRPAEECLALLTTLPPLTLVCLDDADRHIGRRDVELAMFDSFNRIRDHAGTVLLSAARVPSAEQFALPDLASRLLGATRCVLRPLSDEELAAAWIERARARGLEPDPLAVDWLLRHQPRDFKSLIRALDQLDSAALAARRRLSLNFVRAQLRSSEPDGQQPIDRD
jgi:DnaA family protein